jgi:hypothetical protein
VFTNTSATAIALAAEEQAAAFLASNGQVVLDPDGSHASFETPIARPLPEELFLIP